MCEHKQDFILYFDLKSNSCGVFCFPEGIITELDFGNYNVSMKDALRMPVDDQYTMFTPPPPSSGFIVGLILRILRGK